jgi:hypothetical protein
VDRLEAYISALTNSTVDPVAVVPYVP